MTSHDVVFKLRRILHEKKIGHGGTLDPDVVGVLPIAVGKATRILEYMTASGKVYEGRITLGFSTTTEDSSGDRLAEKAVSHQLTEAIVDAAMEQFIGDIRQVPPMYSAVKVKGKRLYEYAREGLSVQRPERQVTISEFERTGPLVFDGDCASFPFRVACSKGTYVRTLAVDLGQALGYPSHMSFLKRTYAGGFHLENSWTLEAIAEAVAHEDWRFLEPIEIGLKELPYQAVSQDDCQELRFGRFITLERQEPLLLAKYNGKAIAILEKRGEQYKPKKVLVDEN
ncbi:tRNA pseudouridine synthase B [Streptococcus sp. DD12]|nr:tRNA pseudouridine synthase B [Streptococcus sp. DD12]